MKAGLALATACDRHYFLATLNLLGSVQANSNHFEAIYVADLGLLEWQRRFFANIERVQVVTIPAFAPHAHQCWSWKPWLWSTIEADTIIYLDAGTEVLRDLSEMYETIQRDDYFVITQNAPGGGHKLTDIIPKDYYAKFDLPKTQQSQDVIAAGVIGFKKASPFYKQVILPTLKLVKEGYNLGWSREELYRNQGLNYVPDPSIRDCPIFRHDQTILNLEFYKWAKQPVVHPLAKYAGIHGRNDDPHQLIWHHRRQSDLPWISHLRYRENSATHRLRASLLRAQRQLKRRVTKRRVP